MVRALAFHQSGPDLIPRLGVICGLSLLLVLVPVLRVFLRVLRFSSLHKNQHFQIPIRPGNSGEKSHSVDSTEIPIYLYIYFIYSSSFPTFTFSSLQNFSPSPFGFSQRDQSLQLAEFTMSVCNYMTLFKCSLH